MMRKRKRNTKNRKILRARNKKRKRMKTRK